MSSYFDFFCDSLKGLSDIDNQQTELLEEDLETLQDRIEEIEEEMQRLHQEKTSLSQDKVIRQIVVLKGTVHYRQLLKIIVSIKTHLFNDQRRAVDSIKHCEKRLPLK